jgi:hypothetical protein
LPRRIDASTELTELSPALIDGESRGALASGVHHELDAYVAKAEVRPLYVDLGAAAGHMALKPKSGRARVDVTGPNASLALGATPIASPTEKGFKVGSEATASLDGAEVTVPAPPLEAVRQGALGDAAKNAAERVDASVSAGVSKGLGYGARFGAKLTDRGLEIGGHASVAMFTGGYKVQIKL